MAITSQEILRDTIRSTHTNRFRDSVTAVYRSQLDSPETDPWVVRGLQQAWNGSNPLPQDGDIYSQAAPHLFAKVFDTSPVETNLKVWDTTLTWGIADDGENDLQQQNPNPLLRPPVFNIEYIEAEYVIEQAENLVDLPHGDGKGGPRDAESMGPIVNAVGKRSDEPQVDTERNAILTVQRNFAALADIAALNENYQRTSNSDVVEGFAVETLKYLVTDSLGLRIEGDVSYYPGVTRIEKRKTTLRIIDNMGYAYWDDSAGEVKDDDDIKDLHNLALDGTKNSVSTVIPYRYLNLVPYTPLVN